MGESGDWWRSWAAEWTTPRGRGAAAPYGMECSLLKGQPRLQPDCLVIGAQPTLVLIYARGPLAALWEMKITDLPAAFRLLTLRCSGTPRAAVGSSMISTLTFHNSARPMATPSVDRTAARNSPSRRRYRSSPPARRRKKSINCGRSSPRTARSRGRFADREAHEKMGFHEGWGRCADQLAALVATL